MPNNNAKGLRPGLLDRAEASLRESESQTRDEMNALIENLPALDERASEAKGEPAEMEARWLAGDENGPTPLAHAEALSEAIRAERIATGTRQRIAALERRLTPGEHDAADALVPAIEALLPGVTAFATHAPASLWEEVPRNLTPCVILLQKATTERNQATGMLSADEVELHYVRSRAHAQISKRGLETAAQDMHAAITVKRLGSYSGPSDYGTDVHRLVVHAAFGKSPVFAEVSQQAARSVPTTVAQSIGNLVSSGVAMARHGLDRNGSGGWTLNLPGIAFDGNGKVELRETFDGKARTTDLTARVTFRGIESRNVQDVLPDVSRPLEGQMIPGLGVCQTASIAMSPSERVQGLYELTITATYTSRTV